jgi:hypothetical protein
VEKGNYNKVLIEMFLLSLVLSISYRGDSCVIVLFKCYNWGRETPCNTTGRDATCRLVWMDTPLGFAEQLVISNFQSRCFAHHTPAGCCSSHLNLIVNHNLCCLPYMYRDTRCTSLQKNTCALPLLCLAKKTSRRTCVCKLEFGQMLAFEVPMPTGRLV